MHSPQPHQTQHHVEHHHEHLQHPKPPQSSSSPLKWLILVVVVFVLWFARYQYFSNQHDLLNANENIQFIPIQGGSFEMGNEANPIEVPVHTVKVGNFSISKTEVTVAQYHKCVEAGICNTQNVHLSTFGESNHCNWNKKNRHLHPMNCVSWEQARTFSKWAGGDLPTESQWEYAMRSQGQKENYPWGAQSPSCVYANMGDKGDACGDRLSKEVCSMQKGNTQQGLCDMMGNVWEWVRDEFHQQYDNAPIDGSAWCSESNCSEPAQRTFRGGAWDIDQNHLQDGKRDGMNQTERKHTVGFRVVKAH